MSSINLELPWPPNVNHYYSRNRNGGVRVGDKGRKYRRDVFYIVKAQGVNTIAGLIAVDIFLHLPDKRRRDVDNVLKCLLDSLTDAGVYEDDSNIVDLRIRKAHTDKKGIVDIIVTAVNDDKL